MTCEVCFIRQILIFQMGDGMNSVSSAIETWCNAVRNALVKSTVRVTSDSTRVRLVYQNGKTLFQPLSTSTDAPLPRWPAPPAKAASFVLAPVSIGYRNGIEQKTRTIGPSIASIGIANFGIS